MNPTARMAKTVIIHYNQEMKICIAQTHSLKGKVQKNIQNHLRIIERAIELDSDLIVFSELSIIGYEPELAKEHSANIENSIFNPFQELADNNEIAIGVGMPTNTKDGINISMLIFQPKAERMVYSKQMLHRDELPYFAPGTTQVFLNVKEKKIAIGICYETLQREHFSNAYQNGADLYIASVAKPKAGIEKAFTHFPKIAHEFNTPILMSNCVGYCDNFLSVGQSAVWDKNGKLVEQLDNENEGMLIYDTNSEKTQVYQLKIEKGQLSDSVELFQIYLKGKNELERNGLYQWSDNYPTISIIDSDLRKGALYTLKNGNEIIGAINISEEQEKEYQLVRWKFDNSKVLVIHRLVVNPRHQRKGYGQKLMDFAENFAIDKGFSSIRLDAYSQNSRVLDFYKKRNYFKRGEVFFPEREYSFHCMEKEIKLPI